MPNMTAPLDTYVINRTLYPATGNCSAGSDFGNNTAAYYDTQPGSLLFMVNLYYGIIWVVGMCGNSLVIYVVWRFSKMHTVTNFFILSLALADLSFLLNLPLVMVTTFKDRWIFGDIYCRIFFTMTTVNQFASSFFLMVMSADRYFAVCHPIRSNKYRTAKAAKVVCAITWLTSATLMIPVFIYAKLESEGESNGTCHIAWPGGEYIDGMQAFTLYCLVLGFTFPLLLIIAFYSMVLRKLKTLGPKNSQATSDGRRRSHRRVTIMVLAVVSAYVICWLPYWVWQVLLVYISSITSYLNPEPSCDSAKPAAATAAVNDGKNAARNAIIYTSTILQALCYTNSSVNPILYAMLSENFKKSFAAACCWGRGGHNMDQLQPERTSVPDQHSNIFARSRNSIRRRFQQHNDEDDDESPTMHINDEKLEITSFLKRSQKRKSTTNGTNKLAPPPTEIRYRNGSLTDFGNIPTTVTTTTMASVPLGEKDDAV
ncbi:somatostatin receptor type 2-like [Paramacrobiotus metropolitanus]|uniref:somatostatin receptor type 2-like n=1 Tax=Paramacrobiotus metropolitanus TaxID=2943436 RepID=UPI0024464253|nr:somatostatin receptor type 2-like [Paramacrobiotus metropolitanus]